MTVDFFFDPVCPFAWMTSRWVVDVDRQRPVDVRWRFISLAMLNADAPEPSPYAPIHAAGLRMLRVAAAARREHGDAVVGDLYTAFGESYWYRDPDPATFLRADVGTASHLEETLTAAGLPTSLAAAADDDSFDAVIAEETELALSRAGRDVGTPILTFDAPDGASFFGPVISELPTGEEALRLWDAVETLAGFAPFAELKRSLRAMPNLPVLGNAAG